MQTPVIMADGIAADVKVILKHFGPRTPVAIPVDGAYAWTPAEQNMFARKIRYSVMAGSPRIAQFARMKDVEARFRIGGDAGPEDVPDFLNFRFHEYGHDDGTVYCSLSTVPSVIETCDAAGVHVPRWGLAWWWGRPGQPTRSQVLAELHRLTGVDLDPDTLWGCQYANHALWDEWIIYGEKDFAG